MNQIAGRLQIAAEKVADEQTNSRRRGKLERGQRRRRQFDRPRFKETLQEGRQSICEHGFGCGKVRIQPVPSRV